MLVITKSPILRVKEAEDYTVDKKLNELGVQIISKIGNHDTGLCVYHIYCRSNVCDTLMDWLSEEYAGLAEIEF